MFYVIRNVTAVGFGLKSIRFDSFIFCTNWGETRETPLNTSTSPNVNITSFERDFEQIYKPGLIFLSERLRKASTVYTFAVV